MARASACGDERLREGADPRGDARQAAADSRTHNRRHARARDRHAAAAPHFPPATAPAGRRAPFSKVFVGRARQGGMGRGGDGDLKLTVAVRTDLGMGRGKIAAQVGHASVMALERARASHPGWAAAWLESGQAKVVVRAAGPKELQGLKARAIELGVQWSEVADAGRTQLEPGTVTCIGFGPAPAPAVDRVTGEQRLL